MGRGGQDWEVWVDMEGSDVETRRLWAAEDDREAQTKSELLA